VVQRVHPDDLALVQRVIDRAANDQQDFDFEHRLLMPDGSVKHLHVVAHAVRDDPGRLQFIGALMAINARKKAEEALSKAGALQNAVFSSRNVAMIATDTKGGIHIFNVGSERMLGYTAAEVMNKNTPADISDPQELIARAKALSIELGTTITPGFEALVFKASRGIEDIYELTYFRKDGSRFPAVVSVTALRDAQDAIIGYLLIGTDNTARKQVEGERKKRPATWSYLPPRASAGAGVRSISAGRASRAPRAAARRAWRSRSASGSTCGNSGGYPDPPYRRSHALCGLLAQNPGAVCRWPRWSGGRSRPTIG